MKRLLWLNILMLSACGSDISQSSQTEQVDLLPNVVQAINEAKANQDHRLMYTLSRNPVIPGFENKSFSALKKQCGIKPTHGTGDVIKSPNDKQERRIKYQFAKEFNTKMYTICQKAEHK
jgi:hypothetical protein